MCGPIFNRIKMCLDHPKKGFELAGHQGLRELIFCLGEQLLPAWCA